MGFSRHRHTTSISIPPRPVIPDAVRDSVNCRPGLNPRAVEPIILPQTSSLVSICTTSPRAGRERCSGLGRSGAASSHQEVVAQV